MPEDRIMQQKTSLTSALICALLLISTTLLPASVKADENVRPAGKPETAVLQGERNLSVISEGRASYYADYFQGRRTASGERFSIESFTAAHRTLPFGTTVRVTNLDNGKEVVVRINDRGPYLRSRIIDVSPAAARELGLLGRGTAPVRIVAVN